MGKEFFISPEKEYADTLKLVSLIEQSGWVDQHTVIVVCSPEYSSQVCQQLNHRLSHLNGNKPFEMDFLEMPYPNEETLDRDTYMDLCDKLCKKYYETEKKLLFIDSGCLRGSNFTILDNIAEAWLQPDRRKFGCLYMQDNSKFIPDYVVETFSFSDQGGLIFSWENKDNPYWPW